MNLTDRNARILATDPDNSYIVQAPAGSGKTEILTQRFLKLLSRVNNPEQIIALTFTRKAANEMRERVVNALQNVIKRCNPTSDHQRETYNYAKAAIKRDEELDWNLLQQPARLRIITLDSLCQTIANAIPLQENQTPYANVSDNPKELYLLAARECLQFAAKNHDYTIDLKNILSHLDNRQDKVLELFCDLLIKREQWLGLVFQARLQNKELFEQAIKLIELHELERFQSSLPLESSFELIAVIQKLSEILNTNENFQSVTSLSCISTDNAQVIVNLLLTSQNTLRKSFDHHVGLKKGVCSDAEYKDLKSRTQILFEQLSELPDFLESLKRIQNLPEPKYDAYQWKVLQSLFKLLPILAAHLNILFNQYNTVDFSAITTQALLGLGEDENPTNLSLYLDNKISHILVDEFQDTSIQQYQLLQQLIQGWEINDGRTLFIVGDPMQSIYRFRAAEVGLFLKVRDFGLGNIKLNPLELKCNFRSNPTIVSWVNLKFKHIFQRTDDIKSGAIKYAESTPTRENTSHSFIKTLEYSSPTEEAEELVKIITDELTNHPEDNIAILARSRQQLAKIMQIIRDKNIAFQGVDVDLLSNLNHIRDVNSLTEALLMPGNRLAWLSFLRSPYCGLNLNDIYHIANFSKNESIFYALANLDKINKLSNDGLIRARYIYLVFYNALKNRHNINLTAWIINTLAKFHIDNILSFNEQEDLEQYWLLIEQFEIDGEISNWSLFREQLNSLYSKNSTTSRLKIMTIHKSKGLEFDTVIIPGIGNKSSLRDNPLLRWLTIPSDLGEDIYLVSPIKAYHDEDSYLYNYLAKIEEEKNHYELQRLFYVAVTRAKKRLYLSDNKEGLKKGSFKDLLNIDNSPIRLLSKLAAESQNEDDNPMETESSLDNEIILNQLPIEFYTYLPQYNILNSNSDSYDMLCSQPRIIGIITHEILQWICNNHPSNLENIPWSIAKNRLLSHGFSNLVLEKGMQQIRTHIENITSDKIGSWILKKHHKEQNEYEILANSNNKATTKIIDRTFYENDIRWIIDFKTGHETTEKDNKYRKQLNEYASYFANTDIKIRCGIYYLNNNNWINWEYLRDHSQMGCHNAV